MRRRTNFLQAGGGNVKSKGSFSLRAARIGEERSENCRVSIQEPTKTHDEGTKKKEVSPRKSQVRAYASGRDGLKVPGGTSLGIWGEAAQKRRE